MAYVRAGEVLLLVVVAALLPRVPAAHADAVCYKPLGCFPMGAPWQTLTRPVPAPRPPQYVATEFHLFTREQPGPYEVQTRPSVSVEHSDYNASRPTVIITHGFQSNGGATWLDDMKNAILHKMDANVLTVGWGASASQIDYFQVVSDARVVGAETARVCRYLMTTWSMSPSSLYLIGHSIGAHIMSYVGSDLRKVWRITGLDPAAPLFEGHSSEVLLDSSDATFVDIVHTDARPLIADFGLGVIRAYGHVDFYANNGSNQPGCSKIDSTRPRMLSLAQLRNMRGSISSCSHGRAHELWTSSILHNCTFLGFRKNESKASVADAPSRNILDLVAPMGLQTVLFPSRGAFFVTTTASNPFCVEDHEEEQIYSAAVKELEQQ